MARGQITVVDGEMSEDSEGNIPEENYFASISSVDRWEMKG